MKEPDLIAVNPGPRDRELELLYRLPSGERRSVLLERAGFADYRPHFPHVVSEYGEPLPFAESEQLLRAARHEALRLRSIELLKGDRH